MTDIKDVDVFNKIVIDLKGVTDKAKAKIIVNGMTTKYPAIPSPTPDAEKLAAEEAEKDFLDIIKSFENKTTLNDIITNFNKAAIDANFKVQNI
jgi:hypothetical protein